MAVASPRARSAVLPTASWEFVKYGAASAAALAVDWFLLMALTEWAHVHYLASAALSFMAGLVVAYVLSVRLVFEVRRCHDALKEFATFCVIGLLGLALNQWVLHLLVEQFGLVYALAKLPTAGATCIFNFSVRRWLLFSPPVLGAARPIAGAATSKTMPEHAA